MDETKRKFFYTNFHLKDGLGVEFTANGGEMMKKGTLTSLTLHVAYRSFAPYVRHKLGHE